MASTTLSPTYRTGISPARQSGVRSAGVRLPPSIWGGLILFSAGPFVRAIAWQAVYGLYLLAFCAGLYQVATRGWRVPRLPLGLCAALIVLPIDALRYAGDSGSITNLMAIEVCLLSLGMAWSSAPLDKAQWKKVGRLLLYASIFVICGGFAVSELLHGPLGLISPLANFSAHGRVLILEKDQGVIFGHSALSYYTLPMAVILASNLADLRLAHRLFLVGALLLFTAASAASVTFICTGSVLAVGAVQHVAVRSLRLALYAGLVIAVSASVFVPSLMNASTTVVRYQIQHKAEGSYKEDATAGRLELNSMLVGAILEEPLFGVGRHDDRMVYGTAAVGEKVQNSARGESGLVIAAMYGLPILLAYALLALGALLLLPRGGVWAAFGCATFVGALVHAAGNGITIGHDPNFMAIMPMLIIAASPYLRPRS